MKTRSKKKSLKLQANDISSVNSHALHSQQTQHSFVENKSVKEGNDAGAQHKQIKDKQKQKLRGKAQQKLTSYFTTSTVPPAQQSASEIKQLKEKLVSQQNLIQKMKRKEEVMAQKISQLTSKTQSYIKYKEKTQYLVIKTMRQLGYMIRKQRGIIDPALGYYMKKQFIPGTFYVKIYHELDRYQQKLRIFQQDLKQQSPQINREQLKAKIKEIKKNVKELYKILQRREPQLTRYKENLKLHLNQRNCTYAKLDWPFVKDSEGNDRYLTLELLGKGGFGEVYKCFDIEDSQYVALKKVNIKDIDKKYKEETLKHVKREIHTQKQLNHPNIVQIKEILQISYDNIQFVMEYCYGRDLGVQLRQENCFQEKQAKKIIHQLFDALEYLSSKDPKVIHYDLKPSNIMYHYGSIRIVDFGLCKLMEDQKSRMMLTSQGTGTYWYLPPEAFHQFDPEISAKLDVWSAGVIFFQLLYGCRPFANGIAQNIIYDDNLICKEGKKLAFPTETPKNYPVSDKAKSFIKQCLQYNPELRLSAKQAFNHPYFKK